MYIVHIAARGVALMPGPAIRCIAAAASAANDYLKARAREFETNNMLVEWLPGAGGW